MPEKIKGIIQKAGNLSLSADQVARMHLYYSSLPLLDDENWLITMANTFAKHLWGSPEQYTMEYIDYAIPDRYAPIPFSLSPGQAEPHTFDLTSLENSYANENKLMEAISKGKLHLVTAAASTVFNNGTNRRLNDSLRDRKNYMIILTAAKGRRIRWRPPYPFASAYFLLCRSHRKYPDDEAELFSAGRNDPGFLSVSQAPLPQQILLLCWTSHYYGAV